MEALAAVDLLRGFFPDLKIRVVNVVDLMRLQDHSEHPHGLGAADFDALFTRDKPVIFAYHGYPWLIHRLTYQRTNHANVHVRGYVEEGTTSPTSCLHAPATCRPSRRLPQPRSCAGTCPTSRFGSSMSST
jgi:xylulose-5-phosphate/fructose-6-phosphate phosphoketolase